MFNWANRQLEKLSETLAPPPSTPSHRFLAALASQNHSLAHAILNDPHEPLDIYAVIQSNRGSSAVHVAASHGAPTIVRELIQQRGVRVDLADYQGWSALHHASHSSSMAPHAALAMVKLLVEECGANVLSRDGQGRTAYDVGSSQTVKGYLLPKQLQKETQECLDNGGRGLVPGIDMGGLKVNYANVAPPPIMAGGGGGGPPPGSIMRMSSPMPDNAMPAANDPYNALMQPPPVRINSSFAASSSSSMMPQPPVMASLMQGGGGAVGGANNNYSADPSSNSMNANPPVPVVAMGQTPQTPQPTMQEHRQQPFVGGEVAALATPMEQQQQQPPMQTEVPPPIQTQIQPPEQQQNQHAPIQNQAPPQQQPPQQQQPQPQQQHQHPPPNSSNSIPSAPNSGYALKGGNANAASTLDAKSFTASGRRFYKPDGFHTSSNDKELQAKYGHVENDFERNRKLAMPPPPKSGGGSISIGGGIGAAGGSGSGNGNGYTNNNGGNNSMGDNNGGNGYNNAGGGANPYSALGAGGGNARAVGYIGGSGRARYPTYCAVSNAVSAPPSLSGAGAGGGGGGQPNNYGPGAAAAVPAYTTFNPGAAVANHNASSNVLAGQTQQWSGEAQQPSMQGNNNAYGASPAGVGGAAGNYGYNNQHQQYPTHGQSSGTEQWNSPSPASSSAPLQHNAYVASPTSGSGGYGYGQQTAPYSQGYAPSPQQHQPQIAADTAATMFGTPSPQQQHQQQPSTADAAASMFSTPHADSKKTFSPPSGGVSFSPSSGASAQDLFASPPSIDPSPPVATAVASAADHFSSNPPPVDANTSTESQFNEQSAGVDTNSAVIDPAATAASNHFSTQLPLNNDANATSAADHFAAPPATDYDPTSNEVAAGHFVSQPPAYDNTTTLYAADHFSAPSAADNGTAGIASNEAAKDFATSTEYAAQPSAEVSAFNHFETTQPSSTTNNGTNGDASTFASPSSSTQDASSFFGSNPNNKASANNTSAPAEAASFFGSAENHGDTGLSSGGHIDMGAMPTMTANAQASNTSSNTAPMKSFGGLPPPPVLGNFSKPPSATQPATPSSFLPPPPMVSAKFSSPTSPSVVNNEDDGHVELMSEVSLTDS